MDTAGVYGYNPTTTTTMGTATGFAGTWHMPHITAAAQQSPVGWKCADCGTVNAPWVPSHTCPPAAATNGTSADPIYKVDTGGENT